MQYHMVAVPNICIFYCEASLCPRERTKDCNFFNTFHDLEPISILQSIKYSGLVKFVTGKLRFNLCKYGKWLCLALKLTAPESWGPAGAVCSHNKSFMRFIFKSARGSPLTLGAKKSGCKFWPLQIVPTIELFVTWDKAAVFIKIT